MCICILFYYLPILPEIDTHALSNVAHIRLPIGNLVNLRAYCTLCMHAYICVVLEMRNGKQLSLNAKIKTENIYAHNFATFFHTVAPAPFLVVALATLGTGENFLISEGHL